MKNLILTTLIILTCGQACGATFYIRAADGSNGTNCTGLADAAYDGAGSGEACALNHPNWTFPPRNESTTRMAQDLDTVIIKPGSYRMGCQNASNCKDSNVNLTVGSTCASGWPFDCYTRPINDVTIIGCSATGCGCSTVLANGVWTTSCTTTRPELWSAGRIRHIFDVSGSNGAVIQDLEMTDHDDCGEGHHIYGCGKADSSELTGNEAIYGSSATNLTLNNLFIHGFRSRGMFLSNANTLTLNSVDMKHNAFIGFDNDSDGSCTNCGYSGTITLNKLNLEFNGCVEDNPGSGTIKEDGCYSQDQSGYGDGLGFANTGGTWIIKDSSISYNVSDGLDLLYLNRGTYTGGTVTINRSHFEGNAGNQVKIPSATLIEDSVIIGNCGFFNGKSTTCDSTTCGLAFNNCRAFGTPVSVSFKSNDQTGFRFYNNTLLSNGDVGIQAGGTCPASGVTMTIKNNILIGGWDWNQPDKSDLFYGTTTDGCNNYATFTSNNNVCDNQWKASECNGANDTTDTDANIAFTGTLTQGSGANSTSGFRTTVNYISELTLASGSVARDKADETVVGQDAVDFNNFARGAAWDDGAFEFDTTVGGATCGNSDIETGETCDDGDADSGDGCSSSCLVETGYSCIGEPSICTTPCGDGLLAGSEGCDDGGTTAGDGCSVTCQQESGWTCTGTAPSVCTQNNVCGNGVIVTPEQCEPPSATCSDICENIDPNYENFRNYTETDTPGYLDRRTHLVQMTGVTHDTDTNIKKDYGASYFGDFTHRHKVQIDSCNDATTATGSWTYDTTSSTSGDNVTSLSWSHTVGSGGNRLLVVGVQGENNATVANVKWNTTESMTEIGEVTRTGENDTASLWYLLNPTTTTANIVVTFDGTAVGATAIGTSYSGILQQAPVNSATGQGTSGTTSPSVTLTSTANNSLFIDSVEQECSTGVISYPASQTERANVTNAGAMSGAMSTKNLSVAGQTTMTATISQLNCDWAMVGAVFSPVVTTTIEDGGSGIWAMSASSYDDLKEMEDALDGIGLSLSCLSSAATHTWKFVAAGVLLDEQTDTAPTIIRYVEESRSGTTGNIKFYSDSQFSNLLFTLTGTVPNDAYRYLMIGPSYNSGVTGTSFSGSVGELDITAGGGNPPEETPAVTTSITITGSNLKVSFP